MAIIPTKSDTIRLLLTSDNHVGHCESDPIRLDDAWRTFHEITNIARTHKIDALIQGGDLFHINKPLKKSMYHVIRSLRLNCMGDKPCELELLSDPSTCLDSFEGSVNYEDPNINISVPVFAISGNHDDALGEGLFSPLDVLLATGLINYFGKIRDNENITVRPVLFQKGTTKLALYGMANVRDERLHRAFRDGIVKFQRPTIQTEQWFNLFCIHQNRVKHLPTSYIPELFLPKFLDFVLWGHEHRCITYPESNPETGFDVLQPGLSVATSLLEGEDDNKHCFILTVKNKQYSLEAIPLKTVRPFVFKDVTLLDLNIVPGPASRSDVITFLVEQVEDAISEANTQWKNDNIDLFEDDSNPKIPAPLIRVRVEYSGGYEIENPRRFSNRFVNRIANVDDVVLFYKKRGAGGGGSKSLILRTKPSTEGADVEEVPDNTFKAAEVQFRDLMSEFLDKTELALIPEAGISHAVERAIETEDKSFLGQWIKDEVLKETQMLLKLDIDNEEMHTDNNNARDIFKKILKQVKLENEATYTSKPSSKESAPKRGRGTAKSMSNQVVSSSSDDDIDKANVRNQPRAYVRPATRKTRPTRGTTRTAPQSIEILDSDD